MSNLLIHSGNIICSVFLLKRRKLQTSWKTRNSLCGLSLMLNHPPNQNYLWKRIQVYCSFGLLIFKFNQCKNDEQDYHAWNKRVVPLDWVWELLTILFCSSKFRPEVAEGFYAFKIKLLTKSWFKRCGIRRCFVYIWCAFLFYLVGRIQIVCGKVQYRLYKCITECYRISKYIQALCL